MDFYQSLPKFGIIQNDYLATEDNRFAACQAGGTILVGFFFFVGLFGFFV